MDWKPKKILPVLMVLLFMNTFVQGNVEKDQSRLEGLFKAYYGSSFLWRNLAHIFNSSTLALRGFSDMFYTFSEIDQHHMDRVIELMTMHEFHFKSRNFGTGDILIDAINNYKKKIETYPFCNETEFASEKDSNDLFHLHDYLRKKGKTTYKLKAFRLLQLTQIIQNCYMYFNALELKKPHLRYVVKSEFSTEFEHRRKFLNDLLHKLHKGDPFVEFFIDKALRTTALKY